MMLVTAITRVELQVRRGTEVEAGCMNDDSFAAGVGH